MKHCRALFLLLLTANLFHSCQAIPANDCPFNYNAYAKGDQCGFVEVPLEYSNPEGPSLNIAYLVIKSKSPNRKADPVVFIQGGPGGSCLSEADIYRNLILDPERDFILYDQRGTGYSGVLCNDMADELRKIIASNLTSKEEIPLLSKLLQECKDSYAQKGISTSHYNTEANAADLEKLRQHLGYEKWNLFAGSYGTRLAMIYMDQFPKSTRSAILMGLYPPQARMYENLISNFDRSLQKIFQSCADDPKCQLEYPELDSMFYRAYFSLKNDPFTYEWNRSNFTLNTQDFLLHLHQMMYSSYTIGAIPQYIKAVEARDPVVMPGPTRQIMEFLGVVNLGVYWSVMAADEGQFNNNELIAEDLKRNPSYQEGLGLLFSNPNILQTWRDQDAAYSKLNIQQIQVPTLLLNGGFDPITPPSNAQLAAESFKQGQVAIFEWEGHALGNPCSVELANAFLDAPGVALDMNCVLAEKSKIDWR